MFVEAGVLYMCVTLCLGSGPRWRCAVEAAGGGTAEEGGQSWVGHCDGRRVWWQMVLVVDV